MCGIFARIKSGQTASEIGNAVERVLNRGYDSVGFIGVTQSGEKLLVRKVAGTEPAFAQWSDTLETLDDECPNCKSVRWF